MLDGLGLDPYEAEVARFMMEQTGETKTDEDTIDELLVQFENEPRYQAGFAAR